MKNLFADGTLVVGLGHRARQGKDILAYYLSTFYYPHGRVYGFATALKAYCRVAHGMKGKDPGLLQKVGAEFRRHQPDKWIQVLEEQLREEKPRVAFISDLRYRNEHTWIVENGGLTVHVKRIMENGEQYISLDRDPNHESEIDLLGADFDYTISEQDGNVKGLTRYMNIAALIDHINCLTHDSIPDRGKGVGY